MRLTLAAILACSFVAPAGAQPTAPTCPASRADHDRWTIKNQAGPATLNTANETDIDVNEMLTWRVPVTQWRIANFLSILEFATNTPELTR